MASNSKSDQRIPVSERTRDALRELKAPGQTYDELLGEFIVQKRREKLATDVKAMFERAEDPAAVIRALEDDDYDEALGLLGLTEQAVEGLTESWQQEANVIAASDEGEAETEATEE